MRMDDGTRLFVEEQGRGPTVLLAHEFGGDWRSWDGLVEALERDHRCIRFSARGFLPSDAPQDIAFYGQDRQVRDLRTIAERLAPDRFHLVGLSMGSFTSLLFALVGAERLTSLTLMGCSDGPPDEPGRATYRAELEREIALLEEDSGDGAVQWFANDPAYRRLADKAPDAWQAYLDRLRGQSVVGALNTLRSLHWNRPPLEAHQTALRQLRVPTLLIHGDEDHPRVASANSFLERTLPRCRRVLLPSTGHLVHIEEPVTVEAELRRQFAVLA